MSRRLYYIDWLRVLAVLLLFPFHTSRVFNFGEAFYVKSTHIWAWINVAIGFVDRWHMPLLFLLAGSSAFLSLTKRTTSEFTRERLLRLGVPLVFGILVIMVPQTWVGAHFNSGSTESIWRYIVSLDFLRWNIRGGGDYYGGFGVGHLWFILFLLVFSLVAMPLFSWGRSEPGRGRLQGWARRLARPAWWLLPPLILWFTEGMPDFFGKKIFYFLAFFVLGYILVADETFAATAKRYRFPALAAGTILTAAYIASWQMRDALADPSLPLFAVNYAGMLGVWTILIGMLGAGRRYLDTPSATLAYLAEASYPLYILHQTVIVVVGWFVVRTSMGGALQWVAVLTGSVAVSFAMYEIVRRVGVLRFLFGMRPAR